MKDIDKRTVALILEKSETFLCQYEAIGASLSSLYLVYFY